MIKIGEQCDELISIFTNQDSNWEEHEHLMNPMFLQSPDEIDLPPLDPELLEHRRHQVRVIHDVVTISRVSRLVWKVSPRLLF